MKLSKIKDKYNLKTSKRKKVVNSKRTSIRLEAEFSEETLQAGREWSDILKVLTD